MQYLDPSEYVPFGLSAETSDSLVTAASAMIDSFCKRPTLGVQQYVQRMRVRRGNTVQLSNTPLTAASIGTTPLVSVRVHMREGCADPYAPLAWEAAVFFTGTGSQWTDLVPSTVDASADGVLRFPHNVLGGAVAEAEVTYTAGYTDIPVPVKIACAQIVRNAQSTPALTVRRQAIDSLQLEYFSGSLLDADVQRLLRPYVSGKVG